MWSVTQLPADALELHAVPRPLGGVLVFGANCVLRLNQVCSDCRVCVCASFRCMSIWACAMRVNPHPRSFPHVSRSKRLFMSMFFYHQQRHSPMPHTRWPRRRAHLRPTQSSQSCTCNTNLPGNASVWCVGQLARAPLASILSAACAAQLCGHHARPLGEGAA